MIVVPPYVYIAAGIANAFEEVAVEVVGPTLFLELQRAQGVVVEVAVGQLDERRVGVVDDVKDDLIDKAGRQQPFHIPTPVVFIPRQHDFLLGDQIALWVFDHVRPRPEGFAIEILVELFGKTLDPFLVQPRLPRAIHQALELDRVHQPLRIVEMLGQNGEAAQDQVIAEIRLAAKEADLVGAHDLHVPDGSIVVAQMRR